MVTRKHYDNLIEDNQRLLKRYEADPRWRAEADGIRKRIERLEKKRDALAEE